MKATLLGIGLIACVMLTSACGPTAEEQHAADQNRCAGFGFAPGTNAFANCMMGVSSQREAQAAADNRAAAARNAAAAQAAAQAAASPPASDSHAAERDAETQRNIKRGEDLENAEARKAGFGPSPTDGMDCTTTGTYSGNANSMTSSSTTHCHN